ncbi:phage tail assembly protein [Aeromonas piscicola]|uniref:Phage tail assembly protein n=1 Tax=Aeromonas piscicola TaxID=600645 RepID=A0ABT7QG52_9GAMM|nr:phage tail assembly protein [Aeromonas piscicola]MDM5132907.1 phage tail assembly protein [Aeromonas piscicola]
MAVMTFDLEHGYKVTDDDGKVTYEKEVGLRELSASDIIDSQLEAEQVVELASGKVASYTSDVRMGLNMLCRQVSYIGEIQGPLNIKQLRNLHRDDLTLLQNKSAELDRLVLEAIAKRGRV